MIERSGRERMTEYQKWLVDDLIHGDGMADVSEEYIEFGKKIGGYDSIYLTPVIRVEITTDPADAPEDCRD